MIAIWPKTAPAQQSPSDSAAQSTNPPPPVAPSTADSLSDSSGAPAGIAGTGPASPSAVRGDSADSVARADSAKAARHRDSLLEVRAEYVRAFSQFPVDVDSVHHPWRLYPYQLHSADGAGISEAMRFASPYVTVPYTLSAARNRVLFMGLPTPRPYLYEPWYLHSPRASADIGTDWLFANNLQEISSLPGSHVRFVPRPLAPVSPVTFLYWENGVFDENTLQVLFTRPLTRSISIGIGSNYRYFRGKEFSHSNGNIYGSFRSVVDDTSLIMNRGINPLTNEHIVRVETQYSGATDVGLSYTYLDLHHGRAYGRDSAALHWDTLHSYIHDVVAKVDTARLGRFAVHGGVQVRNHAERRVRLLDPSRAVLEGRSGEELSAKGYVSATTPLFGNDTAGVELETRTSRKTFYHGLEWLLSHNRIALSYGRTFGDEHKGLSLSGSAGHVFESADDHFGHTWVWRAMAQARLGRQLLSVYARRDVLPYTPPFDPEADVPTQIPDATYSFGTDLFLRAAKLSLWAGYLFSTGVDSASLAHAWPHGAYPYPEPRSVFTIAPSIGRFFGFSLFARWFISDTRPYHKLQGGLSYEIEVADGNEHIRLDVAANYWSPRDPLTYAGIDTWNRGIFDLYVKMAVQIKTFRFFFRVDNILNRKIAYVPGYFMPGLTFRWGFNWYFQR